MNIKQLLAFAHDKKASDLHLTVGHPPVIRLNGFLETTGDVALTAQDTATAAEEMTSKEQYKKFLTDGELDFSYELKGYGRFRCNVYKQKSSIGLALRMIPNAPPQMEDLGLPTLIKSFSERAQGLVLVTGPTGSGKTTTLAAIIDDMNRNMKRHIITLEDPIEYMHVHQQSLVNQRQIGEDTRSFPQGLRAALRQDPDVILVGEMRDRETIQTALTAAETGHLVLATLHTVNAPQTVDRIIDVFPGSEQSQIRIQLAAVLAGIVSQSLLPTKTNDGRTAAMEVLVNNYAVANLIRSDKIHQLKSILETSRQYGMQTIEMAFQQLLDQGIISRDTFKEGMIGRGHDVSILNM
ncbi:type IV pilus twitching motility protein PilT [Salicibibacter kimchii]|uniref:Type IV pilus twitching motility protein PilT n=1 Tax=Salicibibacter kimchii TaxID=2099786 RepID=A0A345BYW7_9BACI|nr:type IV pilus twitching motility protein PilT [Salicibibacter kimchii]AXF56148.1 type IV pilus twitching motility protein PilT [Salicibibacter kimchii]